MSEKAMIDPENSPFDEEGAMEAAQERSAVRHERLRIKPTK
jgi:hypothetical protein